MADVHAVNAHDAPPNNNPLAQFLTPEAMLTPGVAGSLTMMITNALTQNFAMPRAWVGLALSFVFGALVLVATRNLFQRSVFYVLNSLVIFCVAAGANGIGAGATQRASASLSLISTAFAAEVSPDASQKQQLEFCSDLSAHIAAAQKANASPEKIRQLTEPCQSLSKDILNGSVAAGGSNTAVKSGGFFSPWKF